MPDQIDQGYSWFNQRERFNPPVAKNIPKKDLELSKIAGKTIFTNDRRAIKFFAELHRKRDPEDTRPINPLDKPEVVKELKKVLS